MSTRTEAVLTRKNSINKLKVKIKRCSDTLQALKAQKMALELEAIEFMEKEGIEKLSDLTNNIAIKSTDVPTMKDFNAFWNFVRKKNSPELMNRSVNAKGWRDHDCDVPGVTTFTRKTLSITKR